METEYQWAPNSLQQQWSVPGFMTELKYELFFLLGSGPMSLPSARHRLF